MICIYLQAAQLTSFKESDASPIKDPSLVPDILQDLCKDVALSWQEPVLNNELESTRGRLGNVFDFTLKMT